jgi:hypothetical protein
MERALGPTPDRSADQAEAGYRHDRPRGNDRYPNGRRRQLAAAPVAGSCPRLERGRPKGGAANLHFSFASRTDMHQRVSDCRDVPKGDFTPPLPFGWASALDAQRRTEVYRKQRTPAWTKPTSSTWY